MKKNRLLKETTTLGFPTDLPDFMKSEITCQPVWSSVLLGPGAIGQAPLFTYPIGQTVPRLGGVPSDLMASATRLHTNLNCAGEMGSGIGDLLTECIYFEVHDASLVDLQKIGACVRFTLKIGGQEKLSVLLNSLPAIQQPALQVHRSDGVKGIISVEKELSLSRPILLKIILDGKIRYDAR